MKLIEKLFAELDTFEFSTIRKSKKWITDNLVIEDYVEYVDTYNTERYTIGELLSITKKVSINVFKNDFNKIIEEFPETTMVDIDYDWDNIQELVFSFPTGKRPETDDEVVSKLIKMIDIYKKDKIEYMTYLKLKEKYGK